MRGELGTAGKQNAAASYAGLLFFVTAASESSACSCLRAIHAGVLCCLQLYEYIGKSDEGPKAAPPLIVYPPKLTTPPLETRS